MSSSAHLFCFNITLKELIWVEILPRIQELLNFIKYGFQYNFLKKQYKYVL